jgi:hypothetical protein
LDKPKKIIEFTFGYPHEGEGGGGWMSLNNEGLALGVEWTWCILHPIFFTNMLMDAMLVFGVKIG